MELLSKAEALAPDLVEIRRDIHAHPELSFQEERTAALIAERLRGLGFEVRTDVGVTGCMGELHTGAGPTIAWRADMHARPIQEANDVP